MTSISENIARFQQDFSSSNTKLVAVSKTKPNEDLLEAYETGHRDFGENKVQELAAKAESLPKDINWHFIGHLQRNKVKYIAPFVKLIHGVDSERLLIEINKQGLKNDRTIDCLLQIHIADEDTKFGLDKQELMDLLSGESFKSLANIRVIGLMGMATNTSNMEQVRTEFEGLKSLFDEVKTSFNSGNIEMKEISMGMTNDYQTAIEAGSTMVRIGSAIFGARNYTN